MKISVIDSINGIVKIDLSELSRLAKSRKEKKKGKGGEDLQPPPLWIPSPEVHDREGRNRR